MTNEQFDQLVNRIQARYGSRPVALKLRIAWLVIVGYAGFLAGLLIVLVVAAALVAGAIAAGETPSIFLMAIVAFLLAFGLCQTLVFLWVPLDAQPARAVTRDEAPRLFQLLDVVRADLHAPPFDHVWITPEFNAGVQMIPRLGVFGFNRKHLYLGLPLLHSITPGQFAAVLAHEFAHASSHHDRFGMWIYRLRQTWSRVFAELHDVGSGDVGSGGVCSGGVVRSFRGVILWFVDWYWPHFNAHAFVLSRANEYEADRLAAERAGVDPAAQALWRIECFSRRLSDQFWNDLTRLAQTQQDVPDDVVARMRARLAEPPDPDEAARWIEQSARALTGNVDTHPSLSDRLKSLGQDVNQFARTGFPQMPNDSAGDALLGTALPEITLDVNRLWQKENSLRWQNVFHQARRLERQLSPAAATVETTELNIDALWDRTKTVCELQGTDAAEPLLRQVLAQRPSHAWANITLGRHLLEHGRDEGEQFLRRILDEDDNDLIPTASEVLLNHFHQLGRTDKVQETRSVLSRFEASRTAAAKERSLVTAADSFAPHGLSDLELQSLTATLAQQSDIASARLARKALKHYPKQRLFILVASSKPTGLFGYSNADRDRQLVTNLIAGVKLPGRVLVIAPQGGFRALAKKIMSQSDAKVFSRS